MIFNLGVSMKKLLLGLVWLSQVQLQAADAELNWHVERCKAVLVEHGIDPDQEKIKFAKAPTGESWQANSSNRTIYVPVKKKLDSGDRIAVLHEYSHISNRPSRNLIYNLAQSLPIAGMTVAVTVQAGFTGGVDWSLVKLGLYPTVGLMAGLNRITSYFEERHAEKAALKLIVDYPSIVNELCLRSELEKLQKQERAFALQFSKKVGFESSILLELIWFFKDEHPSFARHRRWYQDALAQIARKNLARQSQIDRTTDQEWEALELGQQSKFCANK